MRHAAALAMVMLGAGLNAAWAQPPGEAALRERYAARQGELRIASRDDGRRVVGEIHAVIAYEFGDASSALKDPAHWCEILLLHIDTKDCSVSPGPHGPVLHAGVVSHHDQPASTAYRVDFDYRLTAQTPGYLEAHLDADDGPLDTTDFRIVLEALRVDESRTFVHMVYAYSYGRVYELAVSMYLHTFGRNKVGFTADGLRGIVERNTMRYFLAVQAWLGAAPLPREARIERALRNWYDAAERYPRQLHEVSRERYLEMKRRDFNQ